MALSEVMARCNLFGVLRNMEYLVENDSEAAKLVAGKNVSIQFIVKNGPRAQLAFKNGRAKLKAGTHRSKVKLFFTSPDHFNKMMAGEGNPIPVKGFTHLGFLTGTFSKLAERLEYYLRADDEKLKDPDYFRMNTEMTAYAAFFSLSEIGNHDPAGQRCAHHIPDGVIQVEVGGGPGIYMDIKNGEMTTKKGIHGDPRCILSFRSMQVAHDLLNDKLDTFTGIATGDMAMRGFIPMLDNMNPILGMVAGYLS